MSSRSKLPAGHATHTPPSWPLYPALHAQSAAEVAGGMEVLCAGHARHAVCALALLNVPAGHCLHTSRAVLFLK